MSYLVNSQDSIVVDGIDGLLYANPAVTTLDDPAKQIKVVLRNDWSDSGNTDKVAVVGGGGEGHSPAWTGYVGRGMLTAAVCGNIYASPSSQACLSAILATKSKNVCLVVKNYTGDRLNFGLASELALNQYDVHVRTVLVADDVTQTREQTITGRRGLAGTVLVAKIVGAAAEAGLKLDELHKMGQEVAASVVSIGVASSTCDIPGSAKKPPIPDDKLELGIGIHGESGRELIDNKDMQTTVKTMMDVILTKDKNSDYAQEILQKLGKMPRVVLMVNNTQALTAPEMGIATKCAYEYLHDVCKYDVVRVYSGVFLSSLDMRGFSLSLMFITDDKWLTYLDAPTSSPGWPHTASAEQWSRKRDQRAPLPKLQSPQPATTSQSSHAAMIKQVLTRVADALIAAEAELNELDAVAGDADAGSTFATGAKRLKSELSHIPYDNASQACYHISDTVCNTMGGSSGAVLAILLLAASNHLKSAQKSDLSTLIAAFEAGVQSVNKHSGSSAGGRSLLDAIVPALTAMKEVKSHDVKQVLAAGAAAADKGSESTKTMRAKVGRASYLPAEKLKGVPDAGARAISIAFSAAVKQ